MRRGVRDVRLPRVHRVNGGAQKYHRVTRAKLPAGIPEHHPDFIAAWQAEESKGHRAPVSRAKTGTVAAACEAYLASDDFLRLSNGYRPVIRRHIDAIRAKGTEAMVAHLEARHVRADLSPLTPQVAASRMKAWRKLGAFCHARGLTRADFTDGVARKPIPRTEGHTPWTEDDLAQFRAHWPVGSAQREAAELLQWTGARSVDVVAIGPGMIRDGLLTFRQEKTGADAHVPWHCPLPALFDDWRALCAALRPGKRMVWIVTAHGRPRSKKAFSGWFSEAATAAGLPDLSAHGLRKYRMNRLAEAGASVLQMQAWLGHLTLEEVTSYSRKAERKRAWSVNRDEPARKSVGKSDA